MNISRKTFLQYALVSPFLSITWDSKAQASKSVVSSVRKAHIKLSCNLYSFNRPLRSGELSLEEVIDFCAEMGFDAIDPTGYYFKGYPKVPEDAYIYHIKKAAFLQGMAISGTGVRNDFVTADRAKRKEDIQLVKNWVEVAAKLDAPVLRIFTGRKKDDGHGREESFKWLVEAIWECVKYGKKHGVMITLQNHHEFLFTAKEVKSLLDEIDTDWFGLNLDIGSLRQGDPYEEIAALAPYAYTWQFKENVYRNGVEEKVDVKKIVDILIASGYRGYLPLETLGPGDPKEKLKRFVPQVKEALKKV